MSKPEYASVDNVPVDELTKLSRAQLEKLFENGLVKDTRIITWGPHYKSYAPKIFLPRYDDTDIGTLNNE